MPIQSSTGGAISARYGRHIKAELIKDLAGVSCGISEPDLHLPFAALFRKFVLKSHDMQALPCAWHFQFRYGMPDVLAGAEVAGP